MATEEVNTHAVCMQAIDKDAVSAGFPITCASCDYFQSAQKAGADDCGRMMTCGGPIFGRNFPDYKGPLTPEIMEKICLICGSDRVEFHILAGLRRFSLCTRHRSIFDRVRGPGTQLPIILKIHGRMI